jgi:hypothetical protein
MTTVCALHSNARIELWLAGTKGEKTAQWRAMSQRIHRAALLASAKGVSRVDPGASRLLQELPSMTAIASASPILTLDERAQGVHTKGFDVLLPQLCTRRSGFDGISATLNDARRA